MTVHTPASLLDDAEWAVHVEATAEGVSWEESLRGSLATALAGDDLLDAVEQQAAPGSPTALRRRRGAHEAMAELVASTETILPTGTQPSLALLEAARALEACRDHLPGDPDEGAEVVRRVNRLLGVLAEHVLWLLTSQAPRHRFHAVGSCARAWVTLRQRVGDAPSPGEKRPPSMDGTITHVLAVVRVLSRQALRDREPGEADVDAALEVLDDVTALLSTRAQQSTRRSFWDEMPVGLRTRHPSWPDYLRTMETARSRIVTHRAPLQPAERIAAVATAGFLVEELLSAWRRLTEHLGLVVPTHEVPLGAARHDLVSSTVSTPGWAPITTELAARGALHLARHRHRLDARFEAGS